jgi:hypothetical protein
MKIVDIDSCTFIEKKKNQATGAIVILLLYLSTCFRVELGVSRLVY